ncbi:hypothetical protein IWW39_004265 [Coemansia spiralis]|uniref:C2H2-type domain-containing protein n=1 Tax=Coemansia spiralis TaxID=417178 RepID=A0A9W8GJW4_9FUNG|nr:hypothetical protein IWW39_004265 [Coemansia spiralis]
MNLRLPTTKTTSSNIYSATTSNNNLKNPNYTTTTSGIKTFTADYSQTLSSNNYTTSNNNSSSYLFSPRNMCHFSLDNPVQTSVSPADLLLNTLLTAEHCTPECQASTVIPHPRPVGASRSLPDIFGAPLLSSLNSTEDFVEYQSSGSASSSPTQQLSGLGSAPSYSMMYPEPPTMPYFDAQGSAYDSFLNTPANLEYFMSPNVAGTGQGALYDGQNLFAPLDEFAAKDAAAASPWSGNDLLEQLVNAHPGLQSELVHALVNSINPTVAYQPVGASAAASSSIMPLLISQAQSLADAQLYSADSGEALLVDSLLGMLSPSADVEATPMLYNATSASPSMLELFSSPEAFMTPTLPSAEANDEDDVPLLKRKRCSDGDGSESSPRQAAVDEPAEKKRLFYCDICNRGFSRQYNMAQHRLTHDPTSQAARRFGCTKCTRTFTRKNDLERHQVLHDDTNAFKCTMCSRACARQDVLERHIRAMHKDRM